MRVFLWDVVTQARLMDESFNSPVQAVCFSPSSSYFAVADADSFVTLWNARTLGGRDVCGGGWKCHVRCHELWGPCCGGRVCKGVVLLSIPDLTDTAEVQHDGDVRSLSFSPFGDMLAGGGADDTHTKLAGARRRS